MQQMLTLVTLMWFLALPITWTHPQSPNGEQLMADCKVLPVTNPTSSAACREGPAGQGTAVQPPKRHMGRHGPYLEQADGFTPPMPAGPKV